MTERALIRFDTIVAVCALLVSSIAAGRPNLSIQLENDGAGPALIRSATLYVYGKAVPGWGSVFSLMQHDRALLGGHGHITETASSIDASTTIRADGAHMLLAITSTPRYVLLLHQQSLLEVAQRPALQRRARYPQAVPARKTGSSISAGT